MNAIEEVAKMAHEDWHQAGMPWDLHQRYHHGEDIQFASSITSDDRAWQLTLHKVQRDGSDPNTDQIDYASIIYQQPLEQLPECDPHPPLDDDAVRFWI